MDLYLIHTIYSISKKPPDNKVVSDSIFFLGACMENSVVNGNFTFNSIEYYQI